MWIDRRWVKLALPLSLLVNVFLVGVVTGHAVSARGAAPTPAGGPVVRLGQRHLLSPEEQARFTAVMKAHRPAIAAERKQVQDAKRAAENAIAEPVYDRAKVEEAFANVRRAASATQELNQSAIAEALGTLGPDARKKLLAAD